MQKQSILASFFIPIFLSIPLSGCLEQPGASNATIPNVDVECSQAQVLSPYCRSSGQILWIGLTREYETECDSVLSSLSASQRASYFEAYADNISLTHSGFLSEASITSWKTSIGASASGLPEGNYKICAFIELSGGNNRLDLNEPIGSGNIVVGGESPQVANDWISY